MHNPGYETSLTASRQIQIGRVLIDLVCANKGFSIAWERTDNSRDASFVLVLPIDGRVTFSQEGRIGIAEAGEYVLLSQAAFYGLSSAEGLRLLMIKIPASELRGRLVSIDDHVSRRFRANEHMGRLLYEFLKNIAEVFADRAPPNPQAFATEIISFMALTIGAEDRGAATNVRNTRYYLRRRIIDFIERHLSDQDLSPRKIAAGSRISLSYLYSLFNDDETTVGQFVQAKRLQRAYEILVADPRGHRTVSEVAYEVGFKNVSHFSRSFSRRFNIAPRDARQLTAQAQDGAATARDEAIVDVASAAAGFGPLYWSAGMRASVHETAS